MVALQGRTSKNHTVISRQMALYPWHFWAAWLSPQGSWAFNKTTFNNRQQEFQPTMASGFHSCGDNSKPQDPPQSGAGRWMSFLCTVELSATGPRPPQAGSGCVQRIYISSDPPVDAKRAKCGSKQLPENTVEGTRTTLGRTSRTPRPATRVHNRHHAHASCPRTAQSHMHRQPVTGRRQTRLTVTFITQSRGGWSARSRVAWSTFTTVQPARGIAEDFWCISSPDVITSDVYNTEK